MKLAVFFLGFALMVPLAAAQKAAFDPVPGPQKQSYRFDLTTNFYPDEAAWKADLRRADTIILAVEGYKGKTLASPDNLLAVMTGLRDFNDVLVKLFAYGEFRAAVNTDDRAAFVAYERLNASAKARTSFVRVELKALTPEKLADFEKRLPALAAFHYRIEDVARQAPHTLSEAQESILARFGPDLTSWQPELFQKVFDRTAFPKIESGGKTFDAHLDYDTLIRNPNRAVREKAFKGLYASFESIGDLVGFALYREMKTYNDEAKLHGFSTYYNETLFDRYLTRPQVDNLYAQIEAHLPLYHDYQRYQKAQVEKQLGIPQAEIWDMDIPVGDSSPPMYTADEGAKLVRDSLAVLGPEYSRELAELMDPKNGRLDIVGGPKRDQGAFTEGFYGFFMDNYQGFLTNVSTMAHEAGHAIHYRLVVNHQGHIQPADGPSYMTESFAMFNELLLRDHIMKTAKDPAIRKMVERDTLNEAMYLWELARRAKFEMVAYDRVAAGGITDEKGFNKACEDTGRLYDIWFPRYPELEVHWIRKHHYWSVPTYYVNYVLAHVLSLSYYAHYLEDPAGFPKKYTAMIENGFDRPASKLLKDFLGIDLGDPALLEGTFRLIRTDFEKVRAGEAKG